MSAFKVVFGGYKTPVQVVSGQSQTVHLEIDQVGDVQIPAIDRDGNAINWTGKTLRFVVTDYRKTTVLDLADDAITRGSGTFSIPVDANLTGHKRTLRWRLLEVSGGAATEIVEGLFPVY